MAHVFRGLRVFWALAHVFRGPKVLDPGSCSQRPRIFKLWLMFSEDQGFLDPGSCFQRPRIFGLWLMFSEDQRFWILTHVFRGPRVFWALADLGSCFQRT